MFLASCWCCYYPVGATHILPVDLCSTCLAPFACPAPDFCVVGCPIVSSTCGRHPMLLAAAFRSYSCALPVATLGFLPQPLARLTFPCCLTFLPGRVVPLLTVGLPSSILQCVVMGFLHLFCQLVLLVSPSFLVLLVFLLFLASARPDF